MINVHDAKTQFSKLLDRAERGEEIVISRGGKPVAKLIGVPAPRTAGLLSGTVPKAFLTNCLNPNCSRGKNREVLARHSLTAVVVVRRTRIITIRALVVDGALAPNTRLVGKRVGNRNQVSPRTFAIRRTLGAGLFEMDCPRRIFRSCSQQCACGSGRDIQPCSSGPI
jgi:prevent-host-death family protein